MGSKFGLCVRERNGGDNTLNHNMLCVCHCGRPYIECVTVREPKSNVHQFKGGQPHPLVFSARLNGRSDSNPHTNPSQWEHCPGWAFPAHCGHPDNTITLCMSAMQTGRQHTHSICPTTTKAHDTNSYRCTQYATMCWCDGRITPITG